MEQQREMTMKRIAYLLDCGVFRGWLTGDGPQEELRKLALHEVIGMYDHSLAVMLGVRKPLLQSYVKPSNETNHQSYSSSFFVSIQTVIDDLWVSKKEIMIFEAFQFRRCRRMIGKKHSIF